MKVKYLLITSTILTLYFIIIPTLCLAMHVVDGARQPKLTAHEMIATAYCINGTTATGTQTRVGIAASKKEWFGKPAVVCLKGEDGNAGELLGTYIIEDTGGKPIQNGKVIDIWMPTRDECVEFGRKEVIVYIEE